MKEPLQVLIETAKGELTTTVHKINEEIGLPPCVLEGIICGILADIRSQQSIDLINAYVEIKKNAKKEEDKT